MQRLSQITERKFIDQIDISDWEVLTDTGWHDCTAVAKTVEYNRYELTLSNGYQLACADTHIVFDHNHNEIFVKDLKIGDLISTDCGFIEVIENLNTNLSEHMYDISVDSNDHRYYTNGILSHNTTTAAGFLLWYAMYHPDVHVLIAAHKFLAAKEIMDRIKFIYEELPDHVRAGIKVYNVQTVEFENGSKIESITTTADSGRGKSISLLYVDEFSFVKPRIADEFWTSMAPTLATGGKCIITSTPNTDEDKFAEIWFGANKTIDEYGDEIPGGLGVNGFKAFTAHYSEVPGRDDAWAVTESAKIGADRFRREYGCVIGSTKVTIKMPSGLILSVNIEDLPKHLKF